MSDSEGGQEVFESCYRGRQSALHHMAYMRMSKVLLALRAINRAGIDLRGKTVFDYGFGAGTFFRYCPKNAKLAGVEQDPATVDEVSNMLRCQGYQDVDLQAICIEDWQAHPLLRRKYDLFLCSHVLEHLPDPVSFLRTIRPRIIPEGMFLGLVPLNERAENPHHLHAPNRVMVETWARDAGYMLRWYEENDPFMYWMQPFFGVDAGPGHRIARAISLIFGVPATLLGEKPWFSLGKLYNFVTASKPTQAAFVLTADLKEPAIQNGRAKRMLEPEP